MNMKKYKNKMQDREGNVVQEHKYIPSFKRYSFYKNSGINGFWCEIGVIFFRGHKKSPT
jgi:hypothetical protein